jgi:hypothetical protein
MTADPSAQPEADPVKVQYLYAHQGQLPVIRAALDWMWRNRRPFKWSDVRTLPRQLDGLVIDGVLNRVPGGYEVNDYDGWAKATGRYMFDVERAKAGAQHAAAYGPNGGPAPVPEGLPADLWDHIIGYAGLKHELNLLLASPRRVNALLYGPPASAKSLVIEAILELPGAQLIYCGKGQMTAAGIRRLVQEDVPRYLCIEEIHQAKPDEIGLLLEVLERKSLTTTQYNQRSEQRLDMQVFCTANRIERLPKEILSRLHPIEFPEYTPEQFREVAYALLVSEHKPEPIARLIADGLSSRVKDIRRARDIADMAHSLSDAQFLIEQVGRQRTV